MRLVNPLSILAMAWSVTCCAAWVALAMPNTFDLLPELLWREDIDLRGFTWIGAVWLLTAFAIYAICDQATAMHLGPPRAPRPNQVSSRLTNLTFWAHMAMSTIVSAWIVTAALGHGGVRPLLARAQEDPVAARDVLLNAKLFPGMRLFYACLSGTAALAVAILANDETPTTRTKAMCFCVVLSGAILLTVLPLVMSQRLLLLHYICALAITDMLVSGRLRALWWLALGALAFAAVWFGREALTTSAFTDGGAHAGLQKLLFYTVNDLWNSIAPLSADIEHTWGVLSLRAFAVFAASETAWLNQAAGPLHLLDRVQGGGEFSLFSTAFVDFGAVGGGAMIAGLASLFRWAYWCGCSSAIAAAIYAQIGAALTLAPHAPYVLHQNVLFSVIMIVVLTSLSGRQTAQSAVFRTLRRHG